ncbi:inactive leucine-rich repeat receptor-like protein kinase [Capsicum galapagoense]
MLYTIGSGNSFHPGISNTKMRRKEHLTSGSDEELSSQHKILKLEKFITRMSLKELQSATSDFSDDYLVGIGMLGKMYKAFLPNGWTLAVKKLNDWEDLEDEFVSEIIALGGLRHRNLLPLIGFCSEKQEKLLVYNYMPNGSLHELHSNKAIDLLGKGVDDLILQFLELACQCGKFFPNERPTMLEVYDTVKNISQGQRD